MDVWLEGVSLRASDPVFIFSDASRLDGEQLWKSGGFGSLVSCQASLLSSSLELRAMWIAFSTRRTFSGLRTVALCKDNSTALAYVRNQGGGDSFRVVVPAGGTGPPSPDLQGDYSADFFVKFFAMG